MISPFRSFVMAVDRVEQRLRRVTAALDEAGIRYAVIGGNAVAAWIARHDPSATRTTKDVNLLVRRADTSRIDQVMASLGYDRHEMRSLVLYTDPEEPSKRAGVHLIWAGERVRPSHVCDAPDVDQAVRGPEGFWLLEIQALLRMKLTANRDIDRVHIADMLDVELIDNQIRSALDPTLRSRLEQIDQGRDR